jgi:branched-chain amino acid transport system permease protein
MTKFLELTVAGLTVGALYALVALGFVVIYKATGVINFAQGGLLLFGAYLAYNFHNTWNLPFALAIIGAVVATALIGALVERVILRRMVGQPVFAVIMITLGLLIIIEQVVTAIWGEGPRNMGDPWGIKRINVGDVGIEHKSLWTVVITAAVLGAFFAFFRYSRYGIAMRACAFDQEAAIAQGISARRVFALSWAIAGAVATLSGVMLASGSRTVEPGLGNIALAAFPAIILGGLDSPLGAVIGGVVIGLTQQWTAGYLVQELSWLGQNFESVMPYLVMVLILLVRPFGLFGTPEVRRV